MAIDLDITCYFGGLKKEIIFRAGSGKNSTQRTLPEHFFRGPDSMRNIFLTRAD